MSPAEHYAAAEKALVDLRNWRASQSRREITPTYNGIVSNMLAEAQVHATLATVGFVTYAQVEFAGLPAEKGSKP